MKTETYFCEVIGEHIEDEFVYKLSYWKQKIKQGEIESVLLMGMKPDIGNEYKWCNFYYEVTLPSDSCGFVCDKYNPCNGKNGKCRHLTHCYTDTRNTYKLTKEGLTSEAKCK